MSYLNILYVSIKLLIYHVPSVTGSIAKDILLAGT